MPFWKRSDEEKAAKAQRNAEKKAERDQRKAESRARFDAEKERLKAGADRRKAEEIDAMKALLQEDETLDGMFRTGEVLGGKHVLVTSRRLIVGFRPKSAESVFYRHISGLDTEDSWLARELRLTIAGRKDKLKLSFQTSEELNQLRDLISARLIAE